MADHYRKRGCRKESKGSLQHLRKTVEKGSPFVIPTPHPGPTAIELAFSLSPRGTSGERAGERAGERGISLLTAASNRKQDGPPLPPRREERESAPLLSLLSFANSMAVAPASLQSQF